MFPIARSDSILGSRLLPCAARLSCGTPLRYFPVSIPCASGVKAMLPTPSVFRASFSRPAPPSG
jgi:hypothetical protein